MNPRIKVLAILPAIMPSTTILVVDPLMYLREAGQIDFRLCLENLFIHSSDLEWADLIVFCRNTRPTHDFAEKALAFGKPYIYELDDNFFELPVNSPEGIYHRDPERMAQLKKYLEHAALVRVYSQPLELKVKQFVPRVKLAKPPVNLSSIPSVPPQRTSARLKIVFSTSRTTSDSLYRIFIKDLVRILEEHRDGLEIHFWGYMPQELKGFPSVKFRRFTSNYQKYMQTMYKEGYDIGLAPMKDDLFHNSKTNNKFREYAACWIAGIYSNTSIYANYVENEKTGLLISNEEGEWYDAILRLMQEPNLREAIQRQARALVEREYSLKEYSDLLMADIHRALQERPGIRLPESPKTSFENTRDTKPAFILFRVIRKAVAVWQRLLAYVKEYGLGFTLRIILEQIERYTRYFELLWKLRKK